MPSPIAGHVWRAMLSRYSNVRMEGKAARIGRNRRAPGGSRRRSARRKPNGGKRPRGSLKQRRYGNRRCQDTPPGVLTGLEVDLVHRGRLGWHGGEVGVAIEVALRRLGTESVPTVTLHGRDHDGQPSKPDVITRLPSGWRPAEPTALAGSSALSFHPAAWFAKPDCTCEGGSSGSAV
jgi:hypothetical protein